MRITNTAIFKDLTGAQAIFEFIKEAFNKNASDRFMECIVIDSSGLIGTCEQEDEFQTGKVYQTTSYFIVTKLAGPFSRVEFCTE
jgi:hypothetical protein